MRSIALLFLPLLLAAVEDRPIPAKAILEPAQLQYRSQLLADLDHPVGEHIAFAGHRIAVKRGAKGELELDVTGTGKFQSYSKRHVLPISVAIPSRGRRPLSAVPRVMSRFTVLSAIPSCSARGRPRSHHPSAWSMFPSRI